MKTRKAGSRLSPPVGPSTPRDVTGCLGVPLPVTETSAVGSMHPFRSDKDVFGARDDFGDSRSMSVPLSDSVTCAKKF